MDTERPTWRPRARTVAVAVLAALALAMATVGFDRPATAWTAAGLATAVAAGTCGWALVRTSSQRLCYEDELAAWAAERAAQAERLRIARDLHDLASHGLGLITVRAAAARTVTGSAGEAERQDALADIEQASRHATTELRRMLDVLRTPGPAPVRPAETLADLPGVVQAARDRGITATLDVTGPSSVASGPSHPDAASPDAASPGVQLTVCAVVREALHNTLRHAGPTQVAVQVRRDGPTTTVNVRDAGPRPGWRPQPGAGHGLAGLQERVGALGGTVHAGPVGDGWLLTATLTDGNPA